MFLFTNSWDIFHVWEKIWTVLPFPPQFEPMIANIWQSRSCAQHQKRMHMNYEQKKKPDLPKRCWLVRSKCVKSDLRFSRRISKIPDFNLRLMALCATSRLVVWKYSETLTSYPPKKSDSPKTSPSGTWWWWRLLQQISPPPPPAAENLNLWLTYNL